MTSDTTSRVPSGPGELRDEIARTRGELGQTAAEPAAGTDLRTRVRAGVAERTSALAGTVGDRVSMTARHPVPVAVIAATTSAAVVAWLLIRRSRR